MKCQEAQKKAAVLTRETREYEERREFLQAALESGAQSSRMMVHMETEARAKLNRELNVTNDLYHKLSGQVESYKSKLEDEERKFRQIPEYAKLKSLEEKVASMETQVAEERAKVAQARAKATVEEEVGAAADGSWGDFKRSCVALAGKWVECRGNLKELMNLKTQHRNIELQMRALEIRGNGDTSSNNFHQSASAVDAGDIMEVEDVFETPKESPDKGIKMMGIKDSNPATIPPPDPTNVSSMDHRNMIPKANFGQFSLKVPALPSSSAQSSNLMEGPLDTSAFESTESVRLEPPTPRTKTLHLNLGTSLLNLKNFKKSRKSANSSPVTSATELAVNVKPGKEDEIKLVAEGSQVQSMEDNPAIVSEKASDTLRANNKKSSTPRSRPSSPIPRLINAMFNNNNISKAAEEPKLKSFKLGFPSMFQKKTAKYSMNDGDGNGVTAQETVTPPASMLNTGSSDAENLKESSVPKYPNLEKFSQSTSKPPLVLSLPTSLKTLASDNRATDNSHPPEQQPQASDEVMPSISTPVKDQSKKASQSDAKNLPPLKLSLPSNLKTLKTSEANDSVAAAAAIKDSLQILGSQASKSFFPSSKTSAISNPHTATSNLKSPRDRVSETEVSPFKPSTAPVDLLSSADKTTKNAVPHFSQYTPVKSDQTKHLSADFVSPTVGGDLFQSYKNSPLAGGLFGISQGESDGLFGISQGESDGSFVLGADTSRSKENGGLFDFVGNKSEAWSFNASNDDNEEGFGGFFGIGGAGGNTKDSGSGTFSFFGGGNDEEEEGGSFNLF